MPRHARLQRRQRKWWQRSGAIQPFPANRKVTLRYCQTLVLDPSGGSPSPYNAFRAASIWDPDATGVGHQPWGRDLYAQLYNQYLVLSSKITIRALQTGTQTNPTIYGVQLSEDGTFDADPVSQVMENPYIRWRWIQTIANGNVETPVSMTYSLRKYFNVEDPRDAQLQYGAAIGADPTFVQPYFLVWARSFDDAADIPALNLIVTITYNVLFSAPNWDGLS